MIGAKVVEAHYPMMGFVAAFAEAATIGGIADWYAVVALFKRPLNLPIPHTAIVPANQSRIADNLGRFLQDNFMSRDQVRARLGGIHFSQELAKWLSDTEKSQALARFLGNLVPKVLEAIDHREVLAFAGSKAQDQLAKTDITPIVRNLLGGFTKDGRHQRLLDAVLRALHEFLHDDETLEVIRRKVQKELPTVLYVFQADNVILRRLVSATTELLNEIRDSPDHPLRAEFEGFLDDFITRIRDSRGFARRVEEIKSHLLDQPQIADLGDGVWRSLDGSVRADLKRDDSILVARIATMMQDLAVSLREDTDLAAEIDSALVSILSQVVEDQKGAISDYVAEEVRRWDPRQLVALMEANVGRDLQFIRFNGMLVGGGVGVILYVILNFLLPLVGAGA
ncbi:MAG: DUF445 family protein [Pseudomonadota bacterium]